MDAQIMKKAPIGVKPRWYITEKRLTELSEAIKRYQDAGFEPKKEWLEEFYELEYWLKLYRLRNE